MSIQDKKALIAEETFVVQHSGEIPEVTLHESLYHLSEDPDGPCLILEAEDILTLKHAVVARYRAILLRDLDPENRDKRIYRGLARCLANWLRLHKFCTREEIELQSIRAETAIALKQFLINELNDVQNNSSSSCINCCEAELEELIGFLGLSDDELPEGWRGLCLLD
jgi:hypothetical protein